MKVGLYVRIKYFYRNARTILYQHPSQKLSLCLLHWSEGRKGILNINWEVHTQSDLLFASASQSWRLTQTYILPRSALVALASLNHPGVHSGSRKGETSSVWILAQNLTTFFYENSPNAYLINEFTLFWNSELLFDR